MTVAVLAKSFVFIYAVLSIKKSCFWYRARWLGLPDVSYPSNCLQSSSSQPSAICLFNRVMLLIFLVEKKKSCKYQSYHQSICLIMWWWANRIILVSLRSSRREMKCTFYYFDVWCWWVPSCAWAVRNVAYSMIAAMTLTWWARMSVITHPCRHSSDSSTWGDIHKYP